MTHRLVYYSRCSNVKFKSVLLKYTRRCSGASGCLRFCQDAQLKGQNKEHLVDAWILRSPYDPPMIKTPLRSDHLQLKNKKTLKKYHKKNGWPIGASHPCDLSFDTHCRFVRWACDHKVTKLDFRVHILQFSLIERQRECAIISTNKNYL